MAEIVTQLEAKFASKFTDNFSKISLIIRVCAQKTGQFSPCADEGQVDKIRTVKREIQQTGDLVPQWSPTNSSWKIFFFLENGLGS